MYHKSWSDKAQSHFEKCIAAHGGWTAWNNFNELTFSFNEFSGGLVFIKGLGRSFFKPKKITIDPKNKKANFDYGTHQNFYDNGALNLPERDLHIADGSKIFTAGTFEPWQPEHALYFFGYALVTYVGYPFTLASQELLQFSPGGDKCFFDIRFSANVITHSREQRFYFNKENLLHRHDYRSRIAGPLVFGAHGTENYKMLNGIQIAQTRKVRPRIGHMPLPAYGIYAELNF